MFEAFRKFLSDVTDGAKQPVHFADNDYRLAAAALLVHAAAIDGDLSETERNKLHAVIKRRFDLDDATTDTGWALGENPHRWRAPQTPTRSFT